MAPAISLARSMTTSRPGLVRIALGSLGILAAACSRNDEATDPSGPAPAPLRLIVETDRPQPATGDMVTLLLEVRPTGDARVSGIQGELTFDSQRLRFIGQPLAGRALVLVNDRQAEAGRLRLLALDVRGLDSIPVDLRFEARAPGSVGTIDIRLDEAVLGAAQITRRAEITRSFEPRVSPLAAWPARKLSAEDWIRYLGDDDSLRVRPTVAGEGRIYGDANLTQTVSVADVVSVANVAVGNLPLLTDANRDYAIAANVSPPNLPGLGEFDDALPPGRNSDGTYTISVADVTAIANEAVGINQAVPGEVIPGRGPPPTARVIINDSIRTNRVFYRDTVYELQGTIIVGSPSVSDVTLTIQAGTRIEGDVLTRGRLVIRRGANLVALGTRLEPIVFTCNAVVPAPGCWGGVTINGFGVLNNGDPLPPGEVGFPTKQGIGGSGTYGGILVEDSSGVIRYARIEYAGAVPFTAPDTLPALQLLGVGSGTRLESIQVFQPLGDGLLVSGGTARIRNIMITNPGANGLHWADGWQGRGQFLALQLGTASRAAIVGENFAADPTLLPRSEPVLSHVTVTGPAPSGTSSQALVFRDGSAGIVLNSVVLAAATGLEIQETESCNQTADSLSVAASVFFGNGTDFSGDADCVDEAAFALDPARGNRVANPALIAPQATLTPDLRPSATSPLLTGWVIPPADGFLDQTPTWIGAVAPANLFGSNVPWYAGWTRGY